MSARRTPGSRGLERALQAGVLEEVVAASGMSARAVRALGKAQLGLLDKLEGTRKGTSTRSSTSTSTSTSGSTRSSTSTSTSTGTGTGTGTLRELFARLAGR